LGFLALFFHFALALFPIIWDTPVMRVSFAPAQGAKPAVSLPEMPPAAVSHRKNAGELYEKLERLITLHGIITGESFSKKSKIFWKTSLQAAGNFVQLVTGGDRR